MHLSKTVNLHHSLIIQSYSHIEIHMMGFYFNKNESKSGFSRNVFLLCKKIKQNRNLNLDVQLINIMFLSF